MSTLEQIGNIDGRQRTLRLVNGVLALAAALFILDWMRRGDPSSWWLILVFFLFLGAALGFLQARASTCILLASRGTCHLGGKADEVVDAEVREALALRGRSIARRAFWIAALATALSIVLLRNL